MFTNVQSENVKKNFRSSFFKKIDSSAELQNSKTKAKRKEISIGIVGKYLKLRDAYKSLFEALEHASFQQGLKLKIVNCDFRKKK